jgi:hypothetical protein
MLKILAVLSALLLAGPALAQSERIDQLNPAGSVNPTDTFPLCQGCGPSTNPNKATAAQLFSSAIVNGQVFSPAYIISLLDDADQTGPKTYTSLDGINAAPLTAGAGADIYTDTRFRDPRLMKVGSTYFLSYTNATLASNATNSIGLATSTDLVHWTKISTPNWSSLFTGSQNSIWEGGWFYDPNSGNYYLYFSTAYLSGGPTTPYVVTFNPTSLTFGTPQAVSLSSARTNATVVAVWLSGGTYYGLLQSTGSANNEQNVELLTGTSATGTWTIAGANNFAGWGNNIEAGSEITTPAGVTYVYFCDAGGGNVYYSYASGSLTTGASWSAPAALASLSNGSMDWVDVVQFTDSQTDQAIHALQGSGNLTVGNLISTVVGRQLAAGTTAPGTVINGVGNYATVRVQNSTGGAGWDFGIDINSQPNFYFAYWNGASPTDALKITYNSGNNLMAVGSTTAFGFSSTGSASGGAMDTSLSRISAGLIGVGTGAQGSYAGSLKLSGLDLPNLPTGTPATYACFDAGGNLISSATAC